MAALRHRDRGNGGQKIEISLLESMMHNMDGAFEYYNNLEEVPEKGGRNAYFNPNMLYGAAEAANGWVCVALLLYSERVWEGFCEVLDRPNLYERDRYRTDEGRLAEADRFTRLLEEWLADKPVEDAVDTLNDHGIPAARHNDVGEAAELEHVASRGVFTDVEHPRYGTLTLTDSPVDLSECDTDIRRPAPLLGEHNREILSEHGYSDETIAELVEEGVLVTTDD